MIKKYNILFENKNKKNNIEIIAETKKNLNIDSSINKEKKSKIKKEKEITETIISYNKFIVEDDGGGGAYATAGNSTGMGSIVAPQPSSIPGDVAGSTIGSGDRASYDMGSHFDFNKDNNHKKKKKKTIKSNHMSTESSIENMYVTSFTDWLNNGF